MTSSFVSLESEKELELDPPKATSGGPAAAWHQDVLSLDDLITIDPARARVLQQLRQLATRRQHILQDSQLSEEGRRRQLANLTVSSAARGFGGGSDEQMITPCSVVRSASTQCDLLRCQLAEGCGLSRCLGHISCSFQACKKYPA